MIKVLFLIHDLGVGGAEKVLINLINHMNQRKYNITLISLFGGGVNEQFIAPHVKYRHIWSKTFPANSKLMKVFTPKQLHNMCVKEHYDVEVAYLEGPSARVISGCNDPDTKTIGWIHIEQHTRKCASGSFRSYNESKRCYARFDRIICVSETVKSDFLSIYPDIPDVSVCHNTLETDKILTLKDEYVDDVIFKSDEIKLVAVGKISKNKGFDRIARIVKRMRDNGFNVHLYALGIGPDQSFIEEYIKDNNLQDYYTFLGYHKNPYKYVSKCDLFICASLAEGFSTAASEALIVGTPICTVEVSGMKEMLGNNNEWGIVTENNEDALYRGICHMITEPGLLNYYKEKAKERGKDFSLDNTVAAVENLIEGLV